MHIKHSLFHLTKWINTLYHPDTVETFPWVFFKHNAQDCNGIMTDKNDKDTVNQVNKKQQHELFMSIIFVTIQIIYWCYIGVFSISTNIHHTMSPSPLQYLISMESFDSVVPLKTEHGYNSELVFWLSQNVISPLLWNSHSTNHSHSWCSSRTSYMKDHWNGLCKGD